MTERLALNTLTTFAGFVVQLLFSLIQLKILTNFIPKNQLGVYYFVSGISLIAANIAIAGFQPVFVRFIPHYEEQKEARKLSALLGIAITSYWLLGGMFLFALELVIKEVRTTFAMRAMLLFGFMQLLNLAIQGRRKMFYFALFPGLFAAGFNASLWTLRHYLNPPMVFLLMALWAALISPFQLKATGIRPSWGKDTTSVFKEIRNFWKYAFANSLLYPIILYADRLVIWMIGTPADVADFSVAKRFSDTIRRGLHVFSHVAAPEISHEHTQGEGRTAQLYRLTYILFGGLMWIVTYLIGRWLINILASAAYVRAYRYLLLLVAGVFVSGFWETEAITAYSKGRMDRSLWIWLSWTVLYISLSIGLGKSAGILGVAIAYLVSAILVTMGVILWKIRRET